MKRNIAWMSLSLLFVIAQTGLAEDRAASFSLPGVDGKTYTLNQFDGRIVVLEWTNYDCPFVRKFYGTGTMQKLQSEYTGQGVVWLSVCSSAPGKQGNFSIEEWQRRIKKSGAEPTAVLLDENGAVGREYGASNTPHIFVIDRDGTVAYQGAVDDQPTADPASLKSARMVLADVLDALLAGNPVPVDKTEAYGCSVKYAN